MVSPWTEHRSPTGRLYWYNSLSSTSSWERPDDLKTPAERALASTPWKEYQTAEGRKYWHHTETKETTWTLPDVVREAIEKAAASAPASLPPVLSGPAPVLAIPAHIPPPMHPTFVPAVKAPIPSPGQGTPLRQPMAPNVPSPAVPPAASLPPRPVTSILHSAPATSQVSAPMPEFKTPEDAERAFIGLLRLKGVTPAWTWEQTMRDIITEPLYKALDTLAARKAAWEKFIDGERKREQENREKNIARVRNSWKAGLDSLANEKTILSDEGQQVKQPPAPPRLWWTFERLRSELEKRSPDVWQLCRDDEERKVLWEEYLSELRQRDLALANQLRGRQQEKLTNLIRAHDEKLNLSGPLESIQWRAAQEAVLQSEEFQTDEDLKKMDDLDMLIVFEEEVKKAEKEAMELKAKQKDDKRRTARKTRASYIKLLHELKLAGEIQAGSMWKEVYPLFEDDERYQNMLGLPGSSPLDLFWDLVDDLNLEVEKKQKIVEDVLSEKNQTVTESTELEEFLKWFPADTRAPELDSQSLKQVFNLLRDRAIRLVKDEKRRADKRLRNQVEDLRYALKKLSPPVEIDTPYDDAIPRFSDLTEYQALEGHEDGRKEAYNRYMERLKEKATTEEKKIRKKEDDHHRSENKKKNVLQHSDDEGSVISSSKRRRKDYLDDDNHHRHQSPRSSRLDELHSSPRGGDYRDRDRDRSRGRGREREKDSDAKLEGTTERDGANDGEHDQPKNSSRDKPHDMRGSSRSRDRERDRDHERDRPRSRDRRDRVKERGADRDRSDGRSQIDDRRRRDYESDRHGSRHHRSSRRDRDYEDRDRERDREGDGDRRRSGRYEDEDRHLRDKKTESSQTDLDAVDKRARSRDPTDPRVKESHMDGEPDLKRVKTDPEIKPDKPAEKSDGEEGELEG